MAKLPTVLFPILAEWLWTPLFSVQSPTPLVVELERKVSTQLTELFRELNALEHYCKLRNVTLWCHIERNQ